LKMEVICLFEILVHMYQSMWSHIPEECYLYAAYVLYFLHHICIPKTIYSAWGGGEVRHYNWYYQICKHVNTSNTLQRLTINLDRFIYPLSNGMTLTARLILFISTEFTGLIQNVKVFKQTECTKTPLQSSARNISCITLSLKTLTLEF
jgi:hypothetical protein